ncbi:TetR family transcriptional regulator [Micromonospora sp. CPCC 205371]|nr:TetR family transcriptional regulator [Micromonospora sp. CPCC 205371]
MTGRRPQRPRDPEARRAALAAAVVEVVAEVGIGRTTHRAVAARAGLPLGATTYYFPTLDDLVAAGLTHATEALRTELDAWSARLRTAADPAAALAGMVAEYLADRRRARVEYELYVAAARDPALRPLAEAWLRGLCDVLAPHAGEAARDVAALVDGAVLQSLAMDTDLDQAALAAAIRRLMA